MEQNMQEKLELQSKKLDAIFASVEKTRKYFRIVFWITIAMIILPVVGLVFIVPQFINIYTESFQGLL